MSVSPDFRDHALDLLSLAGPVSARAMFGGVGLFIEGTMFGLLDDDELFLKADDECRAAFTAAGCAKWSYPSPKGPMETSYYRPPEAALDDAETLLPWARLAIAAARRKQALKVAKEKPKKPPVETKKKPTTKAKPHPRK